MADLEWIVQVATAVSLLATAVAAVLTLREYQLKAAAERRMQKSTQAEIDIRIMQLFAETVRIAQSRGGDHVSEQCIKQLFAKRIITKKDFEDLDDEEKCRRLFNKLRICAIAVPTAEASQDAAIAAIEVLAGQYRTLRRPARAGLEAIKKQESQKQQAEAALTYLNEIESAERQEPTTKPA
jgi:hypothetical protein